MAFLDASDMALTDADNTEPGFQVALAAGANIVKVKVTGRDGIDDRTYTLTVLRARSGLTPADVLVSNTGRGHAVNVSMRLGGSVTTGGVSRGGYSIDQICIRIGGDADGELLLRVFNTHPNNRPRFALYTFADPAGGFVANSLNCFDAPDDAVLERNTTYSVVLSNDAGSGDPTINYSLTAADAEDPGAAPGWRLGDTNWNFSGGGFGSQSVRILVRGRANADPSLRALALADAATGDAIALNEAFVAGALSYTADAAGTVETVTVTPTASDGGATVAFLDQNDQPLADADDIKAGFQLALAENASIVKVKVTARDSIASWTYTLTVNRAGIPDATGAPAIAGVPQVGQTLTAGAGDIADPDDLPAGTFPAGYTLQWVRVAADSTETDIDSANAATYAPVAADVGHRLKVKVSFTDGSGDDEALESALTEAVVAEQDDCATDRSGDDWCTVMTVGTFPGQAGSTYYGFHNSEGYGALADRTIGRGSDSSTVFYLHYRNLPGRPQPGMEQQVEYGLDPLLPRGTALNLGGQAFAVGKDSEGLLNYSWLLPRGTLAWLPGQKVTVSLRFPNPSTDAALRALALHDAADDAEIAFAPAFDEDIAAYTADLAAATARVTLAATPNYAAAAVAYLDAGNADASIADADADKDGHQIDVAGGTTTVKIRVTAEDGTTTKDYTLALTRAPPSADATLSGIALDGPGPAISVNETFDPATLSYTANAANAVATLTVTPTAADDGATVAFLDQNDATLADADDTEDGFQLALAVGANTLKIRVTAENGTAEQTYTLVVTRAAAPVGDVLISNFGKAASGDVRDYTGQRFTTGPNPGGYTIDQIGFEVGGDNTGEVLLRVYTVSGGNPGRLLYTFTPPAGGLVARRSNYFDAPANAVLEPNRTYIAVFSDDSGTGDTGIQIRLTQFNGEDNGAAPGWSIHDDRNQLPNATSGWSIKIQVRGRANADPTLSALALENAATGDGIDFNETFAAGTLRYTADAANAVETVTVTPTAADGAAAVAFLDENDATLADADGTEPGFQLALAEGANTVKVQVTGSDNAVTRTYTLTVFRARPGLPPAGVLVSNTGQNTDSAVRDRTGQRFRTGPNPSGYTIDRIGIEVGGDADGEALLRVYTVSGNRPSSLLYTFADPAGGFAAGSVNYFEAPAGAVLEPNTTYMAVLSDDAGTGNTGIEIRLTGSDSEDSAAAGWNIHNDRYAFPGELTFSVKMQVHGRANADPTLSALALANAADGSAIDLNETFAADTLGYTADAANAVETVTVTPTAADAAAGVAFLDENDRALTDADDTEAGFQLALDVGANIVQVQVTGSDAVASRTYTLIVTRARLLGADAALSALALADPFDDSPVPLTPAFDPATLAYSAAVSNAVDRITLKPEAADALATVAVLDDGDNALTDADADADGFQADLAVGANTLKVTVTAEDGTDERTYTLTVSREGRPVAGTLVSNTGTTSLAGTQARTSQKFTTGGNLGGYRVDSIDVPLRGGPGSGGILVRIFSTTAGQAAPTAELYRFANPGTVDDDGTNRFAAPAGGAMLEPNTTYAVVITNTGGNGSAGYAVSHTTSKAEDSGAAAGWSIADSRQNFSSGSWSSNSASVLRMAISGATLSTDADASLSALELTDPDGNALTLSPAFARNTAGYRADAAAGSAQATVAATATDGDATVAFLDVDGRPLRDADTGKSGVQAALEVGLNTVLVRVTAPDGATRRTYRVIVDRAMETDRETGPVGAAAALVSNTGKSQVSQVQTHTALAFTTGPNPHGYTVDSIGVGIGSDNTGQILVRLFSTNANGSPKDLLHTFADPASLSASSVNDFAAPAGGAVLEPSTTYSVVISNDAGTGTTGVTVSHTNTGAEDSGKAEGWSIANRKFFPGSGNTWDQSTGTAIFRLRIVGRANAFINRFAAGAPAITGGNRAGDRLSADLSDIADPDGIADARFDLRWIRVAADDTETEIAGADGPHYTLTGADVGSRIRVRAAFTDDAGGRESLASPAHGPILPAACPEGADWCARMTVGTTVGVSGQISGYAANPALGALDDPTVVRGGDSWTVQSIRTVAGETRTVQVLFGRSLPRGSVLDLGGHTFTLDADAERGAGEYRWTLPAGLSWSAGDTVTVALRLKRDNAPAAGVPDIAGLARVGRTLTAGPGTIADADGLPAAGFPAGYSFQWVRADSDGNAEDIAGATGATYTLAAADLGFKVSVRVSFADAGGNAEGPLASAVFPATGEVLGAVSQAHCPGPGEPNAADWCAVMTVGTRIHNNVTFTGYGLVYGRIDDVNIDHGGVISTIEGLNIEDDGTDRILAIELIDKLPEGTTIAIGGTAFTAAAAADELAGLPTNEARYRFDPPAGFGLSDGDTVAVAVRFPNFDAEGRPAVLGLPRAGQTLTAGARIVAAADFADPDGGGEIADRDGLDDPQPAWQWVRIASDDTETDIDGATEETYTLTGDDAGKRVAVKLSLTDGKGRRQTLRSDPVLAGAALPDLADCPEDADWCATLTVGGTGTVFGYGTNYGLLGPSRSFPDGGATREVSKLSLDSSADPATLSFNVGAFLPRSSVLTVDGTDFTLDADSETGTAGNYEFDAPAGFALNKPDEVTVSLKLNTAATGRPAIVAGVLQAGNVLTADTSGIADADGLDDPQWIYQWVRVDDDGSSNPVNVGANMPTYALTDADAGKKLLVKVSFTDHRGNREGPLASRATRDTVRPAQAECPADADFCTTMT
ncbi:MAG: cadherin-like beta sandwich domain-containing protein, partial [bacterium]|nr:cadherin-like beta sandwich domain-containing protein [bacterium]